MAIVGGLDIHRRQITYDWMNTDTGETCRGQPSPATRVELRGWLARLAGQQADFAVEATTGWRFVAEEPERAGFRAHLAEPADTRALRGPKRRAKTDRTDAHHLRELLRTGTLPGSWPPPAHVADARTQVRLRHALIGARTGWYQRIHAILFHHGLPDRAGLLTADGRAWLASVELPAAARGAVDLALRMVDRIDAELDGFDTALARTARQQPGCKALMRRYGIGWLTAVAVWAEFGDVRRFANAAGGAVYRAGRHRVGVWWQARPRPPRPPGLPGCCAGRCTRRPCALPARAPRTTPTTLRPSSALAASGPRCRWRAGSPARPATPCATSATRHWPPPSSQRPPDRGGGSCAAGPQANWCGAVGSLMLLPPRPSWTTAIGRAAAPAACGNPITHHVAGPCRPGTEIGLDARAATPPCRRRTKYANVMPMA
jgi:hypothetical protein